MAGSTSIPGIAGFPLIDVTNYLALGYPSNEPINFHITTYGVGQKFTWVKGNAHSQMGRGHLAQPFQYAVSTTIRAAP